MPVTRQWEALKVDMSGLPKDRFTDIRLSARTSIASVHMLTMPIM